LEKASPGEEWMWGSRNYLLPKHTEIIGIGAAKGEKQDIPRACRTWFGLNGDRDLSNI